MCIRYYVAIPLKIGVVMKKSLNIIILTIVALPVAFAGYVWWRLQPKIHVLPLPEHLMAIDSAQGQALLDSADAVADYRDLAMAYQSQELISYCGVASAATVLNAMGKKTAQNELFTTEASEASPQTDKACGGPGWSSEALHFCHSRTIGGRVKNTQIANRDQDHDKTKPG